MRNQLITTEDSCSRYDFDWLNEAIVKVWTVDAVITDTIIILE